MVTSCIFEMGLPTIHWAKSSKLECWEHLLLKGSAVVGVAGRRSQFRIGNSGWGGCLPLPSQNAPRAGHGGGRVLFPPKFNGDSESVSLVLWVGALEMVGGSFHGCCVGR